MFFFQTCFARVFSNRHNSHNKHIKFKKFGGNIAQLLCLDLYKYKISRQIDSNESKGIHCMTGDIFKPESIKLQKMERWKCDANKKISCRTTCAAYAFGVNH